MLYEKYDEQNEWRYVLALYHYYRAYELRPNAYPADNAKLRIQACRQELAKTESLAPLYPAMQRDLERLKEENLQLRKQVEFLQGQVLARNAGTNQITASPGQTHSNSLSDLAEGRRSGPVTDRLPPTASGSGRKHTVREKETFASIAR